MITQTHIANTIIHEMNVCKFLVGKIPADGFDYRPSEKQRSTLELLRYIAVMPLATVNAFVSGDFGKFREYSATVAEMTPEQFGAVVDENNAKLRELIEGLSDDDFNNRQVLLPTRESMPFDVALMSSVVKWIAAYKMQLFLYAKALGSHELSTVQCWAGMDPA